MIPQGQLNKGGISSGSSAAGLLNAAVGMAKNQAHAVTDVENCMVVGGWRIVRLDDAQGAELARLDPQALEQRLEAWIGQDTPPGAVARVFDNDAARPGTVMTGQGDAFGQWTLRSLSLRAFSTEPLATTPMPPLYYSRNVMSKWVSKPLKRAAVAPPAGDQALVAISITGPAARCSDCFVFQRMGDSATTPASEADGLPDLFEWDNPLYLKPTIVSPGRKTYVFAIPAGRWRLQSRAGVELCLGAPWFEAKGGETLYLGAFDLTAPLMRPDLAPDEVRRELADAAPVAAALKPVAWREGATWACHAFYPVYALRWSAGPSRSP